jgi:hypothetical protein
MGLSLLLLALLVGESTVGPQDASTLGWMAGCWSFEDGSTRLDEQWMAPAGGTMLGTSRVVAGGKTVFTEFMHVGVRDSRLTMSVMTGVDPKSVPFAVKTLGERDVTFENPDHDFPQRILYRLAKDGRLFARIEGTEKGVAKGEDYRFTRGACR